MTRRLISFPGIETAYPDLTTIPDGAEFSVSIPTDSGSADYNVTLAQLREIVGTDIEIPPNLVTTDQMNAAIAAALVPVNAAIADVVAVNNAQTQRIDTLENRVATLEGIVIGGGGDEIDYVDSSYLSPEYVQ